MGYPAESHRQAAETVGGYLVVSSLVSCKPEVLTPQLWTNLGSSSSVDQVSDWISPLNKTQTSYPVVIHAMFWPRATGGSACEASLLPQHLATTSHLPQVECSDRKMNLIFAEQISHAGVGGGRTKHFR